MRPFLALTLLLASCAGQSLIPTDTDGGPTAGGLCTTCAIDSECASSGGLCAQFAGATFCARSCPNGQSDCASGTTCAPELSAAGDPVSICEPNNGACGGARGSTDAGVTPPSRGDAGVFDAGVPPVVTGGIGPNGGKESTLYFGIIGDTRPPAEDDTSGYPSATIGKIFGDIAAMSPMPPFVVATGDYQFAKPSGSEGAKQLALYTSAKSKYSGYEFPALGNHECTGGTATNCGPGSSYLTTNNLTAFVSALLTPIGKSDPYYSIEVDASDGSWTAKLVFVAANYWNTTQATWLDTTLSKSTTYTFIVRHESKQVTVSQGGPAGVDGSEAIMAKHPYTLAIVGHTHTYYHPSLKEVIFGNGGAPLSGSGSYGYGVVTQKTNGDIQVDEIDLATGTADSYFTFRLHPDGTSAP